jgi:hypothetical protein
LKIIVFSPAAIVTLAGKMAAALVLDTDTSSPPVGAGPVIVKVAVQEAPPVTTAGVNTRLIGVGARTIRIAVLVTVP